jgi:tryptophan synthase alpha subunit
MAELHESIGAAIRTRRARAGLPIVAYMTAGFPDLASFRRTLRRSVRPRTSSKSACRSGPDGGRRDDPARESAALRGGFTLPWLLRELGTIAPRPKTPLLLMSYLNPLLAYGSRSPARSGGEAGVAGFIIPDLPYEEAADVREALARAGLALVQTRDAVTPPERLRDAVQGEPGFVYAVTMTGTTGKSSRAGGGARIHGSRAKRCADPGLRRVRHPQPRAGRQHEGHVDGVVVGSALVEVLEARRRSRRVSRWAQALDARADTMSARTTHIRGGRTEDRSRSRSSAVRRWRSGADTARRTRGRLKIARRGWTLVYGGGRVGLMGLLADAALAGGARVVGVIPKFLFTREVAHDRLASLEVVDTFAQRKQRMGELRDAYVSLPGGVGTMDEMFEAWSWSQAGLQSSRTAC